MKWEETKRRQFIANLPSEACTIFTPGLAWLLAGFRTCRHDRQIRSVFLLAHLPGFRENQWHLGVRSCLPLRGSPGFAPGSLSAFPWEHHQQTNHKIECCSFHVNPNVAVCACPIR
jgi:hypothetical protein